MPGAGSSVATTSTRTAASATRATTTRSCIRASPAGRTTTRSSATRSTGAYSTPASLREARTTCKPRADKGAYWVPTLYQDGREVRPSKGQFYYNLRSYTDMHPFPAGLKMVAGDQHAHHPQPLRVTYWACGGGAGVRVQKGSSVPATCPVVRRTFKSFVKRCPTCPIERQAYPARIQTYLELHVDFPDCWDGKRLDSPDHQSHMAYSRNYVCPGLASREGAAHPGADPLPDHRRAQCRARVRRPAHGACRLHQCLGPARLREARGRLLPHAPVQRPAEKALEQPTQTPDTPPADVGVGGASPPPLGDSATPRAC